MEPVKLGIGVASIGRLLPLVGKGAGLFEQESIAVEVVNQRDEEKVVRDIVSGIAPIGTPNAPSLLFSCLEGNDLVIVGGVLNRPAFFLVTPPSSSMRTFADLKGKRVGINQPESQTAVELDGALDTGDVQARSGPAGGGHGGPGRLGRLGRLRRLRRLRRLGRLGRLSDNGNSTVSFTGSVKNDQNSGLYLKSRRRERHDHREYECGGVTLAI